MALFCSGWERSLRAAFPARLPPARGFLAHKAELAQARAAAEAERKRR